MIRRQRIHDSAVNTDKIAADTIIPADVDETQAYNFTNTASTWKGALFTGTTVNITNSTFTNIVGTSSTITTLQTKQMMAGELWVSGAGASTELGFQDLGAGTFSAEPHVIVTPYGATSGTTISLVAKSASSFSVYASHASSIQVVAMKNPYL